MNQKFKKALKKKALNDLIKIKYESGIETGEWNNENFNCPCKEYCDFMKDIAEEYKIPIPSKQKIQNDYSFNKTYEYHDILGFHLEEQITKKIKEILLE